MKVPREGMGKLRSIVKALKNYKLDVRDKSIEKAKDYMELPTLENGRMLTPMGEMRSFKREASMRRWERVHLSFV